jgi:hypothetical protein
MRFFLSSAFPGHLIMSSMIFTSAALVLLILRWKELLQTLNLSDIERILSRLPEK